MKNSEQMAKYLLEIGAVKLSLKTPFTWTSGIESPVYCNNRETLGYPEILSFIKDSFCEILKENQFGRVEAIASVATAGIPHGSILANHLNLPSCYVRPEPKKHGLKNQIEGPIPIGKRVVVVEDLISTSKSSTSVIEVLQDAGCEVIGLIAIFTYGFKFNLEKILRIKNISFRTITNFETLCRIAMESNFLNKEEFIEAFEFAKDPMNWRNNAKLLETKNS